MPGSIGPLVSHCEGAPGATSAICAGFVQATARLVFGRVAFRDSNDSMRARAVASAAMSARGGRKPGRALSELELRHVRLLLQIRTRAQKYVGVYDELLEDFVLECRESGASARGMAEALGVGPSTIQAWTSHARRRRNAGN